MLEHIEIELYGPTGSYTVEVRLMEEGPLSRRLVAEIDGSRVFEIFSTSIAMDPRELAEQLAMDIIQGKLRGMGGVWGYGA